MKARTIGAVVVMLILLAAAGYGLLRKPRAGVPLTAQGVPLMFGGPWLRPDTRYGPTLDSAQAGPVQAAALAALPEIVETNAPNAPHAGLFCVGILRGYLIADVPAGVLASLRSGNRRFVAAGRCRFRVETLAVDGPGVWQRQAWLLWATVPEEPSPGRAVVEVGYHARAASATVWRCFLSQRDGRWLVDSTVLRWRSVTDRRRERRAAPGARVATAALPRSGEALP
jgi:hypothetical protein